MPVRLRKLVGAIALIVLVVTWTLIAMAVAQLPAIKFNGLVEGFYYFIAGMGWVLPGMLVVKWMMRQAPEDG
jgi:uncharacterized protein DUF2842